MSKYEIEVTEVQRVYYRVEADDEDAAIDSYKNASVYTQICMMVDSKGDTDYITGVREVVDE